MLWIAFLPLKLNELSDWLPDQWKIGHSDRMGKLQHHFAAKVAYLYFTYRSQKIDWRVIDADECDSRIKRELETFVIRIWQGRGSISVTIR